MGDSVWPTCHPDGPRALAQGMRGLSELLSLMLLVLECSVCRNTLDPRVAWEGQRQRSLTTRRAHSSPHADIAWPQEENCRHVGLGYSLTAPSSDHTLLSLSYRS